MTHRFFLRSATLGPAEAYRPLALLAAIPMAAILLAVLAAVAGAAPEYALSGQAPKLAGTLLAQTPLGPVSALDVLMLDDLTDRAAAGVPIKAWTEPTATGSLAFQPAMRQAIEHLVVLDALARRSGAWRPQADQIRVGSFGASEAVWIEAVIKPQIKVEPIDIERYYLAHPEQYFNRLRAQVRYLFLKADLADPADKNAVRAKLDELATQIRTGKISFEEAARRHSQAPSAAAGGLIPPFDNGAYFPTFEDQTFQLEKPGQLSLVFEGPEGFYLLQLVQLWPARNIPIAQANGEIRDRLRLDLVRHYFNYVLSKKLEPRYVRNNSPIWGWLNLESPIVNLDKMTLSRQDYLRFFEDPVGSDFQVRVNSAVTGSFNWVQGEAILQDLEARGQANHPWIARVRQLAELPLKTRHVYAVEVPATDYRTTESAMATIGSSKAFTQELRSVQLVSFTTEIHQPEKLTPADRVTAQAEQQGIVGQLSLGILPNPNTPLNLKEWVQKQVAGAEDIRPAVRILSAAAEEIKFPKGNVHLIVADADWRPVMPGSEYLTVIKDLKPGQLSAPVAVGTGQVQYLVVAERPLDPAIWKDNPLSLKTTAFEIDASRIYHAELDRIRQSGAIKTAF
jgi:hypothetical protein